MTDEPTTHYALGRATGLSEAIVVAEYVLSQQVEPNGASAASVIVDLLRDRSGSLSDTLGGVSTGSDYDDGHLDGIRDGYSAGMLEASAMLGEFASLLPVILSRETKKEGRKTIYLKLNEIVARIHSMGMVGISSAIEKRGQS